MTRNRWETSLNIVGLIACLLFIVAVAYVAAGIFPLELEY